MKKLFVSLFAVITLGLSVTAQDSSKTKKEQIWSMKAAYKGDKKGHKKEMKELNLSEDQKKELIANREEARVKKAAIQNDKTLTETERNAKLAELHKEQKARKNAVLTPEQKEKLAQSKQQHRQEQKQHAEKKRAQMKSELGLSDEQAGKLKDQEKSNHAKMKAIKEDNSLDEAAKKKKMEELKTSAAAERKAVLTPDQQKKMEEIKKEKHAKRGKTSK